MKNSLPALLLIGVLFSAQALAAPGSGGYTTGKDFVRYCSDMTQGTTSYAWCKGFITGYDQAHTTMSYITKKQKSFNIRRDGLVYCPPENVSHLDAIKIIVKYIKDHPKSEHLPAGLLTSYALNAAFGCDKKNQGQDNNSNNDFGRD